MIGRAATNTSTALSQGEDIVRAGATAEDRVWAARIGSEREEFTAGVSLWRRDQLQELNAAGWAHAEDVGMIIGVMGYDAGGGNAVAEKKLDQTKMPPDLRSASIVLENFS